MTGGVGGHPHGDPSGGQLRGVLGLDLADQAHEFVGVLDVARVAPVRVVGVAVRRITAQREDAAHSPADQPFDDARQLLAAAADAGEMRQWLQRGLGEQAPQQGDRGLLVARRRRRR